jgi:hypothetical protein
MSNVATPGPAPIVVRGLADVALRYSAIAVALAGPAALDLEQLDPSARGRLAATCELAAELNDALIDAVRRLPEGQPWPG